MTNSIKIITALLLMICILNSNCGGGEYAFYVSIVNDRPNVITAEVKIKSFDSYIYTIESSNWYGFGDRYSSANGWENPSNFIEKIIVFDDNRKQIISLSGDLIDSSLEFIEKRNNTKCYRLTIQ